MACGKPVVVTAAGGLDFLVGEQGGVKAPVGDPEKLADALIGLLRDPQRCKEMGEHNCAVAVSTYDWEVVLGELERVYKRPLKASSALSASRLAAGGRGRVFGENGERPTIVSHLVPARRT